jgi:hypothetical protein
MRRFTKREVAVVLDHYGVPAKYHADFVKQFTMTYSKRRFQRLYKELGLLAVRVNNAFGLLRLVGGKGPILGRLKRALG